MTSTAGSSVGSTNPLPATMSSVLTLPLECFESGDYSQQISSIDTALQTLGMSKANLKLRLQSLAVTKGWTLTPIQWSEGVLPTICIQSLDDQQAAEYDAIQQAFGSLNEILIFFEKLRATARERLESSYTQPPPRGKTNINKLPDELQIMIFNNFRHPLKDPIFGPRKLDVRSLGFRPTKPDSEDTKSDIEAIKNIRLTCRQFCRNSTHLLVRRFNVSLNLQSLKDLEEMSKICQGERILNIDLRYYSAALAEDFQLFSAMCCSKLDLFIGDFDTIINIEKLSTNFSADSEYETALPPDMSLEDVKDCVTKGLHILSSWEPFSDGTPFNAHPQPDTTVLALWQGYHRYREKFQQQAEALRDGHFARAFAAAAAASNSKVWLYMSDWDPTPWEFYDHDDEARYMKPKEPAVELLANPHQLVESVMIQPQHWHAKSDEFVMEIPQSLLYEIPLAMPAAGAQLVRFEVLIQHPPRLNLEMSSDQLSGLMEVSKGLETFLFQTAERKTWGPWPKLSLEDVENFFAYLHALQWNVSNSYLGCDCRHYLPQDYENADYGNRLPIEPLLRSPNWHRMKWIDLKNFHMNIQTLRRVMDMLESGVHVGLEKMHLGGGTWAEALDCLRSKVGQGSFVASAIGAECGDLDGNRYHAIFHANRYPANKATQYINSADGVENPLVDSVTWGESEP